jgi:hypothetical protein
LGCRVGAPRHPGAPLTRSGLMGSKWLWGDCMPLSGRIQWFFGHGSP